MANPTELALRQELALTQNKLQGYADRVIHLSNELRTLRESICTSCKERLASRSAPVSTTATTASFPSSHSETPIQPASFWRRIWHRQSPAVLGPYSPIYVTSPASHFNNDPNSLTLPPSTSLKQTRPFISTTTTDQTNAIISRLSSPLTPSPNTNDKNNLPTWSVQKDIEGTLNVTFTRSFIHKGGRIRSVRFSPDGKHLAVLLRSSTTTTTTTRRSSSTGAIIFFDVESGEKTGALMEPTSQKEKMTNALCMCFSPDARYLVVGDTAGRVTVWDVPNRRIRNVFTAHTNSVESVDISPHNHTRHHNHNHHLLVASASIDKTIRIWSTRDGTSLHILSHSAQGLWSVKFSPDGTSVVGGNSAGVLMLWDVRTGRLVYTWAGHRRVVLNVVFFVKGDEDDDDGRGLGLVSGSGDGVVKYWDIGAGAGAAGGVVREILEYKGHTTVIKCISISPDARYVASASYDKTAIVWDARSAVRQCTLVGHEDAVVSVDFSNPGPRGSAGGRSSGTGGGYIVTASQDGHATLWKYDE